jgi:hypothetical protein
VSIHDERELRARLSVLLDGVQPSLPPVSQVVRRGRGIRVRRWISVAAGLAVVAAGAVLVPSFLQGHRVSPSAPLHYKVTVTQLGGPERDGVVGAGTIDNKPWRVAVTRSMGDGCALQAHLITCGLQYHAAVGPRQVSINSGFVSRTQFELGTVGHDVTRVVIVLSNGTQLSLHPVTAGGQRWVALAAPLRTITRAVSFVGTSEYRYALPYLAGGAADFIAWLQPGEAGLPVANASVGSGELNGVSWHAAVHAGPWGYCVSAANGGTCIPVTSPRQLLRGGMLMLSLACGPLSTGNGTQTGASSGVKVVPPDVKDVVLRFADRSRLRLAATEVAGTRVFGYALPARPAVVQTLEYGVTGRLLHSVAGAWPC